MDKLTDFSPNFSKKPRLKKDIKFIIIHYTGMQSEIESIRRLKSKKSKVSCHYLISRNGKIIQLISDLNTAWHAGKSKWKNFNNLNKNSIGIELVNKGHENKYQNFPNIQIRSFVKLCKELKKKYKIKDENFLGHSDIAPLRKIDPGEKFPWKKISRYKMGRWYNLNDKKKKRIKIKKNNVRIFFFRNLLKIGYRYFSIKKKSHQDKNVIKAFQMRYLPKKISGQIDKKTLKISHFLANI